MFSYYQLKDSAKSTLKNKVTFEIDSINYDVVSNYFILIGHKIISLTTSEKLGKLFCSPFSWVTIYDVVIINYVSLDT